VDIGGTHIACGLVNLATGALDDESRRGADVDASAGAREILDRWCGPIEAALESRPVSGAVVTGIGVAIPGPFDYANGISYIKGLNKYESLYGLNVKREFTARLHFPEDRILFLNDASCFALGENWVGAGRGFGRLVAVTLGTGFGSALVSGARCVESGRGVPPGGAFWNYPCRDGIAEDFFNGRWLLKRYEELAGRKLPGVFELAQTTIEGAAEQVDALRRASSASAVLKRTEDPADGSTARRVFLEYAENLAAFLAPWLKEFAAECLVVGGNIARSHRLFLPKMMEYFVEHGIRTRVVPSVLLDKAAIIGAAGLLRKFEKNGT